ncbi:hypothetical protein GFM13_06500 [Rhizobium leguminosarum bv. viciae]|nr:hypothetical protein [Rhizobium leguminosarum bv. viciae]
MVVLLDRCLRARTIAASMVIARPEAIGGAPGGVHTAKEELSCPARNGRSPGEESWDGAVAP